MLAVMALLSVAAPFMLYAWAGLYLPAGYSALLNTTAVLFGTLSSAWFKEDTLTARKLLGCLIGFIGVGLIVRLGPVPLDGTTLVAALACVCAAACYGLATPVMKRATARIARPSVHSTSMRCMGPSPRSCSDSNPSYLSVDDSSAAAATASPRLSRTWAG